MKVLVIGASAGSGRAAVDALLAAGHEVTAFSRSGLAVQADRLRDIRGDAMNPAEVDAAVRGQDAVIVTLGIRENALKVRFAGTSTTPMNVRSAGTRNVIAAMKKHGVRRLVVQTSFGVGETRARLPLIYRLMFALLLKPQIADTEAQEREVRASGLDWVLAQPVNLTDADGDRLFESTEGDTRNMKVSRRAVAGFLVRAAGTTDFTRCAVALSSM